MFPSHTDGHSLKWHIYHGSKRIKDVTELGSYEIVVTTYHTVSSEWHAGRALPQRQGRRLHDIHWRRVVLDEGMLSLEVYVLLLTIEQPTSSGRLLQNWHSQFSL